jgi:hypothetical protein
MMMSEVDKSGPHRRDVVTDGGSLCALACSSDVI